MTVSTTQESQKLTWHRRPLAKVGLLALLAVCVVVAWSVYQRKRYHHFAAHDAGKVYRSAYLAPDVYAEVIREYNIRTVVNLCNEKEKCDRVSSQRQAVEEAGARLVEIQFPNNDTWHTDDPTFQEIEQLFDDLDNYPIWIHCVHGKERTAKALVIYDVRKRGMNAHDSLAAMPIWGSPHPWPIVAFAYGYETRYKQQTGAPTKYDDSSSEPSSARLPTADRALNTNRR